MCPHPRHAGARLCRFRSLATQRAPAVAARASAAGVNCEALSIKGGGRELFALMRAHDLEGIVAKRLADLYDPRVRWLKIKNPDYTQQDGRSELFNRPSQRRAASARP